MPLQGRYVDALDNENKLLYPKTAAAQVVYSPNKSVRKKIDEIDDSIREINVNVKAVTDEVKEARDDDTTIHLTLKKRLDSMRDKTSKVENEIKEAREKDGVVYDNLSDRLKMTDSELGDLQIEIEDARGDKQTLSEKLQSLSDGNQLTLEEVIQARNGKPKLDNRLDEMDGIITTLENQIDQAKDTFPNLKVRLDTMTNDAMRTDDEVVKARTSFKDPAHPFATLKDRLDAMDQEIGNAIGGNYLPLAGGHVTGNISSNNGFELTSRLNNGTNCTLIGTNTNFDGVHVGDDEADLTLWSKTNPKWNDGGDDYDIITSKGGTMVGSIVLSNNNALIKGLDTNGQEKKIAQLGDDNRIYIGDENSPLYLKGTRIETGGHTQVNGILNVTGNLIPNGAINQDLGYNGQRWQTIWGNGLNINAISSENANIAINKPINVSGDIIAQDGIVRARGWGRELNIVSGNNDCYINNSTANSYLSFLDNGYLQYSHSFIPTTDGTGHLGENWRKWEVVWATQGVQQGSDRKLKEDIQIASDEPFFNMIKNTKVHSYLYKLPQSEAMSTSLDHEPRKQKNADKNDLCIGVIAQDLARHDCSKYLLHHTDESGYSINLYNYSASLHSALRYEISKREALEKEFAEFKELVSQKLGTI